MFFRNAHEASQLVMPGDRACLHGFAQGAEGDSHIPASLKKAETIAQRLRWLLSRISLSRLNEGIGRSVVQKLAEHWWHCEGSKLCSDDMAHILAQEGSRASGDHTYGVVRNLAAYDEDGMAHVLRASLFTIMGEGRVLGFKVRCPFPRRLHRVLTLILYKRDDQTYNAHMHRL